MLKRKLAKRVGVSLFVLIFLAGCSLFQSKPAYVVVSQEYTKISKAYNDAWDAATPEIRIKWHKEIDPAFDACDKALNIWRDSIGKEDAASKRSAFDAALKALIVILTKYGVLE